MNNPLVDMAKISGSSIRYRNPIMDCYLADPFILPTSNGYCLFGSHAAPDGRRLPVYWSSNLAEWEFVGGAVAVGREGAWNRENFWAPEVLPAEGKFWLYYTAAPSHTDDNRGNRIGVAVSSRPEGPYEDVGVVVPHASLDGSPFRDSDGSLYLYYTVEHENHDGLVAGRIYVDRLLTPDRVMGNPALLVSRHPWQEGPCVMRRGGVYFLTYSIGSWGKEDYEVRWCTGSSAFGPFEEQPTPILKSTPNVKGPGHHNFFQDPRGRDWIVYHGWDPAFTARYPRIDPLLVTAEGLSCKGPSDGVQAISG